MLPPATGRLPFAIAQPSLSIEEWGAVALGEARIDWARFDVPDPPAPLPRWRSCLGCVSVGQRQQIAQQEQARAEPLLRRRALLLGLRQHLVDQYGPRGLNEAFESGQAEKSGAVLFLWNLHDRAVHALPNEGVHRVVDYASAILRARHDKAQAWVQAHGPDAEMAPGELHLGGYGLICEALEAATAASGGGRPGAPLRWPAELRSRVVAGFWKELDKGGSKPRRVADVRALAQRAVAGVLQPPGAQAGPSATSHSPLARRPAQAGSHSLPGLVAQPRPLPRQPVDRGQDPLRS